MIKTSKTNSKIYMLYHCPCLDGTYTLMNLMLVIRTKVTLYNWTFDRLYERIVNYLK